MHLNDDQVVKSFEDLVAKQLIETMLKSSTSPIRVRDIAEAWAQCFSKTVCNRFMETPCGKILFGVRNTGYITASIIGKVIVELKRKCGTNDDRSNQSHSYARMFYDDWHYNNNYLNFYQCIGHEEQEKNEMRYPLEEIGITTCRFLPLPPI